MLSVVLSCLWIAAMMTNTDNNRVADIENPIVKEYISNVVYDDDDYTYTKVLDYCNIETDWDKSCPLPVHISIDDEIVQGLRQEGIKTLTIQTFKDDVLFREDVCELCNDLTIYNLIPNQEYHYYVSNIDSEGISHSVIDDEIYVSGHLRAIYVDGMHNFRDIGGYPGLNGKFIKYDKILRSAELLSTNPVQGNITQAGINEVVNNIKIDVELDIGDSPTESPISNYVELIGGSGYRIGSYAYLTGNQSVLNCFNVLCARLKQNKKILIHCKEGCDRTGTLLFVLEALLGVCESDLAKDYEISSMYFGARQRNGVYSDTPPNPDKRYGYGAYRSMIEYIKSNYTGDTINEKVENMMLNFGVSHDQIELFRQIMLEEPKIIYGDVNDDRKVNAKDIIDMVNYIMDNKPNNFNKRAADVTEDGVVNIVDIVKIINILDSEPQH